MTRPVLLAAFLAGLLASAGSPAPAQDKKDEKKDDRKDPVPQKDVAAENLKKVGLKGTVVETEHFLVACTLPEEKAKALGGLLEKVVPVARKALQFEEKEEPWKGKLAVYFFPESREFKLFMRTVVQTQPDGVHIDVRANDPFVVDPAELTGKPTEADQFASAAGVVAAAYLQAKANPANVPEWLRDGFGRVTALRAEGTTSKRYQAYKTAARAAVLGARTGVPAAASDLWGGTKPAGADVLANSLAEFMAYGPGSMNFPKLLSGFRPDEGGNTPSPAAAFESAGWKDLAALDKAWQKWVQTGK